MTIPGIIHAVQSELKKTYPFLAVDGKAGPQTWTAIYNHFFPSNDGTELDGADQADVDPRSEKNIATLHPRVRPLARSLLLRAKDKGWKFVITSGTRTYAEQDVLYSYGRTVKNPNGALPGKPLGARPTNARGGYSNHNFGLAFDVTLFSGKTPVWESPLYAALAAIGEDLGLEWGGDWKTFKDKPHYQLRPQWADGMSESQMLAELRRRQASGRDFYA